MLSREMDPNRGRSGRSFLQLEGLELRDCPSSAVLQGHTLFLTGDASDSTMRIRDGGHGNVTATVVDGKGHRTTVTGKDVQRIEIHSKSGNDRIDYALTGTLTTSEQISLDLGKGNDQASLNYAAGVAAPSLTVRVTSSQGYDEVSARFGAIRGTNLDLRTQLGNGPSQFRAWLNGDLTGNAKVFLGVNGGRSYDGIDIKTSGNIAATAQLAIDAEGGPGKDTVHVDYWGRLDGKLTTVANGGPGDDWVESNIRLAAGSKGKLDAKVLGGPGDDLLILRVHDLSHHLQSLKAVMDGGAGLNWSGDHTSNVRVVSAQQ
jgi:hypothetical protein